MKICNHTSTQTRYQSTTRRKHSRIHRVVKFWVKPIFTKHKEILIKTATKCQGYMDHKCPIWAIRTISCNKLKWWLQDSIMQLASRGQVLTTFLKYWDQIELLHYLKCSHRLISPLGKNWLIKDHIFMSATRTSLEEIVLVWSTHRKVDWLWKPYQVIHNRSFKDFTSHPAYQTYSLKCKLEIQFNWIKLYFFSFL